MNAVSFAAVLSVLFFSVFIAASAGMASAFNYAMDYNTANYTVSSGFLRVNGMGLSPACSENVSGHFSASGASVSAANSFYAPSDTFAAINYFAGSNPDCQLVGRISSTADDSKIVTQLTGATVGNLTVTTKAICPTTARYFDVLSGKNYLSIAGEPINRYANIGDIDSAVVAMKTAGECNGHFRTYPQIDYSWGYANHQDVFEIYPFNSSAGNVKYFIQNNASAPMFSCYHDNNEVTMTGYAKMWLMRGDGVPVFQYNYSWNCYQNSNFLTQNWSGELDLTPDTMYYFIFGAYSIDNCVTFCSTVNTKIREPVFVNISVDVAVPAYVCPAWGGCIDGYKGRTCIDNNGISPPRIDIMACGPEAITHIDLGFEEMRAQSTFMCQPTWAAIDCPYAVKTYDTYIPIGWVSSSPIYGSGYLYRNYVNVVSDAATVGTKSVRLNYVPYGKIAEPTGTPPACGNLTEGAWPEIAGPLNETGAGLEQNITFASSYASLSFDVKKCSENVKQYDFNGNLAFYAMCGLNFVVTGKPFDMCYAPSCNSTVGGKYGIRIVDIQTGKIMLSFADTAGNEWTRGKTIDLSNAGFQGGHNYTVGVSVKPHSQYDSGGFCVYFDAMGLDFSDAPLISCESRCDGLNYISATPTGNGSACLLETEYNAPSCVLSETGSEIKAEAATNHEDFCFGTTRQIWNNQSRIWISLENSAFCVAEAAAENAEAAQTEGSLGLPEDSPMAPLNSLLNPLFVALVINVVLAALCAVGVGKFAEGAGSAVGAVFLGVLLCVALVFSYVGIYPAILGVMIMVISGLLLAALVRSTMAGGG